MSAAIFEDYDWESEDSEDWESGDAFAEDYDSVEDIGERVRRRSSRSSPRLRGVPVAQKGIRGMVVPGRGGLPATTLRFPQRVATAAQTNRGMGALLQRLDRLEARSQIQTKNENSTSGLVYLIIAGGLTGYGVYKVSGNNSTSKLVDWSNEKSTEMAALASATQLATTGVRLATTGRYSFSVGGTGADAVAVTQLALFAFARLRTTERKPYVKNTLEKDALNDYADGNLVYDDTAKKLMVVVETTNGKFAVPADQ